MDLQLKGRRALVVGSTQGIGFAIANALAKEGVAVTVTGRTQDHIDSAVGRIRATAPDVEVGGIVADCASAAGAETVFGRVAELDILVNSLGIYERRPFFEIADADWLRLFETNVLSGVRFARRYTPAMVKRGWGRVLFVSSESALNIPKEMIHYGTTKTAQLAVSRGLAMEVVGTGVTVNTVLPGPTTTENSGKLRAERAKAAGITVAQLEKDFFDLLRPTSLIRRFATPEETATLCAYLCSPLAAATTGAAIRCDGGVVNQIM